MADVVQVDAVDLEVDRVFAIAGGDERVGSQTTAGRSEAAGGGRNDPTRG